MPQQTITSTPVFAPEPYRPRPVVTRVTQSELFLYWASRRAVEYFESKLRGAQALRVEPGELTVPALRATH
ncbi:hypothetical protein F183_A29630 [Bryobacterales bacterium F-183]|nr:hypothetical protein F183_A29630 [Bryobacterales bacterium F-183]